MNKAGRPAARDLLRPGGLPPRRGSLTAALEGMKYRRRADEPGLYKERSEGALEAAGFTLLSSFLPLVPAGRRLQQLV